MRLPNGYGSVTKLNGKRRKPYMVRKTKGFSDDGRQEYIIIGYYSTKGEALNALARYNENPYQIDRPYTFSEVYDKWSAEAFEKISRSNVNGYKASYKIAEPLYDMRMCDIKLEHMQECVDSSGKNYHTLRKFKVLLSKCFEYAVVHEFIDPKRKEYIQYLDIDKGNPNAIDRTPFTHEEVDIMRKMDSNEFYMIVLILVYTGVRIGELLDLKRSDVHLKDRWFYVGKAKTDAGIREVPIAKKILPYIKYWHDKETEYLITNPSGGHFRYKTFCDSYWKPQIPNHLPHDTRHTCISWLVEARVDDRWIKAIVGHKGQSVTEKVYTHIELPYKLEAIDMI